jgi:hypothetical protein
MTKSGTIRPMQKNQCFKEMVDAMISELPSSIAGATVAGPIHLN